MKKLIMAIIAATVALTFAGCNDTATANVHWTAGYNPPTASSTPGITDIKWEKNGVDQTWTTSLTASGQSTETLEVTELVGYGRCFEDGLESEIWISDTSSGGVHVATGGGTSATLDENADVNLVIERMAK